MPCLVTVRFLPKQISAEQQTHFINNTAWSMNGCGYCTTYHIYIYIHIWEKKIHIKYGIKLHLSHVKHNGMFPIVTCPFSTLKILHVFQCRHLKSATYCKSLIFSITIALFSMVFNKKISSLQSYFQAFTLIVHVYSKNKGIFHGIASVLLERHPVTTL